MDKVIESPDGRRRVVFQLRADGHYTYRMQFKSETVDSTGDGWSKLGPDCGIYDSAETAEIEARLRVGWLRERFH